MIQAERGYTEVRAPGGRSMESHLGGWPPQELTPSDALSSFPPCLGQNPSRTLVSDKMLSGVYSRESCGLSFSFDNFYLVFLISNIFPLHGETSSVPISSSETT